MNGTVRANKLHMRYERKGKYFHPGDTAQKCETSLWGEKKKSQYQLKKKEKKKEIKSAKLLKETSEMRTQR